MSTSTLYDQGLRYLHLNSPGTTVVRSTATKLSHVKVNTEGAAGSALAIYNGQSTAGDVVANIGADGVAHTKLFVFDTVLSGGLTVDVTNSPDITIFYK